MRKKLREVRYDEFEAQRREREKNNDRKYH
jgi:hypothetical protein